MKKPLSLFVVLLVVMIPLSVSAALAEEAPANNAAEACVDNAQEGQKFVDFMENGVIDVLTKASMAIHGICTTLNSIHSIISYLGSTIGYLSDPMTQAKCGGQGMMSFGLGSAGCAFNDAIFGPWMNFYKTSQKFCIPIEQGFCSGKFTAGKSDDGDVKREPLPDSAGLITRGSYKAEGFMGKAGDAITKDGWIDINSLGLSPYDNIYTASICLSVPAILHNLKQLKEIYVTYNCCVEDACSSGRSISNCKDQLDVSTCMYFEGALFQSLYGMLSHIITQKISGLLHEKIVEWINQAWYTKWIAVIIETYKVTETFESLKDSMAMITESFDSLGCDDLEFGDYTESDVEELERERLAQSGSEEKTVQMVDTNNDGVYDVIVNVKTGEVRELGGAPE